MIRKVLFVFLLILSVQRSYAVMRAHDSYRFGKSLRGAVSGPVTSSAYRMSAGTFANDVRQLVKLRGMGFNIPLNFTANVGRSGVVGALKGAAKFAGKTSFQGIVVGFALSGFFDALGWYFDGDDLVKPDFSSPDPMVRDYLSGYTSDYQPSVAVACQRGADNPTISAWAIYDHYQRIKSTDSYGRDMYQCYYRSRYEPDQDAKPHHFVYSARHCPEGQVSDGKGACVTGEPKLVTVPVTSADIDALDFSDYTIPDNVPQSVIKQLFPYMPYKPDTVVVPPVITELPTQTEVLPDGTKKVTTTQMTTEITHPLADPAVKTTEKTTVKTYAADGAQIDTQTTTKVTDATEPSRVEPAEAFDLCKAHPDTLGCQKVPDSTVPELAIPKTEIPLHFSPIDDFSTEGVCPTDRSVAFDFAGQHVAYTWSYVGICDFVSRVRPVIVLLGYFFAALICYAGVREL